ncbi:hypothetical protein GIB67_032296 [Kingdonia uniflora]|uniref:Uncharacterized protein n=1 Tax=Kingdonia uniflora TaxID=39325 RepID=A0A7J7MX76_9MAGN|nr:hypothetical protein GIB67_032296 [Kingdonia uniflora]
MDMVLSIMKNNSKKQKLSTKDHVSHEDESKTSKDSVDSSENDVQVLAFLIWWFDGVTRTIPIPDSYGHSYLSMKSLHPMLLEHASGSAIELSVKNSLSSSQSESSIGKPT